MGVLRGLYFEVWSDLLNIRPKYALELLYDCRYFDDTELGRLIIRWGNKDGDLLITDACSLGVFCMAYVEYLTGSGTSDNGITSRGLQYSAVKHFRQAIYHVSRLCKTQNPFNSYEVLSLK